MNKLLSQLWPHLSPAIHKAAMAESKKPIQDAIERVPLLSRVLKTVRIDVLDLGTRPFRVDSIKSYSSSPSDNWIMCEASILYGGDMRVRIVAEVSFLGLFTVDVPIEVANVQLKALARMTLYPLVEQLPCVGGVTISFLEQPMVDLDLHVLDGPDLFSLPPIPVVLRFVERLIISKMLIYPNEMSFPVLPNYGLPKPPIGICRVAVEYGIDLRSSFLDEIDPFVRIELREGRIRDTASLDNESNPVWKDEEFDMLVDDMEQMVTLELYDDNELTAPGLVGAVRIPVKDLMINHDREQADEIPNSTQRLLVPVYAPTSSSKKRSKRKSSYEVLTKDELRQARHGAFVEDAVKEEVRKQPQVKLLIPYLMRRRAAKKARKKALAEVLRREQDEKEQDGNRRAREVAGGAFKLVSNATKSLRRTVLGERSIVGHICLETAFIPLASSNDDDPSTLSLSLSKGEANGTNPTNPTNPTKTQPTQNESDLLRRMITFSSVAPTPSTPGILSVHIIKATQLSASAATYVELVCQEQNHALPNAGATNKKHIKMTTPSEFDPNPKFDYRVDLNINAGSTLTFTVCELSSDLLRRVNVRKIGYAHIDVMDVVDVGHVRDAFSLIGAESGELHVSCQWMTI